MRRDLLLIALLAIIGVVYHLNDRGSSERLVVARRTMQQFSYADVLGHTIVGADGGTWHVPKAPGRIPTKLRRMRIHVVGDGYVNVTCR